MFHSVGLALDLEFQRSACDLILFCKCLFTLIHSNNTPCKANCYICKIKRDSWPRFDQSEELHEHPPKRQELQANKVSLITQLNMVQLFVYAQRLVELLPVAQQPQYGVLFAQREMCAIFYTVAASGCRYRSTSNIHGTLIMLPRRFSKLWLLGNIDGPITHINTFTRLHLCSTRACSTSQQPS